VGIRVRKSVVIGRPIQQVWSYLDNESNDPIWRRPFIKQVTRLDPKPTHQGAKFRGTNSSGDYLTEVTRCEPPTRMSWTYVSYSGPVKAKEGSYLLENEGDGTRMTLEESYDTPGVMALLSMPISLMLGLVIGPRLLKQLKAGVEAQG